MTSIFFTSLVNTGIIVLFTNAKLSFVPILNFLPINNQYTDFGEQWYVDVGPQFVKTMLITAFFPYVELLINISMK